MLEGGREEERAREKERDELGERDYGTYIHYVNANVPNTFEEALNSSESKEWQKAMNSEIENV